MKSIEQIIKNRQSTDTGDVVAHRKVIRSPHTGKEMLIPGHVSDYIEQDAKTTTEFNVDRYAEAHWNWRRDKIKKRQKRDRHFPAIEHPQPRTNITDSD